LTGERILSKLNLVLMEILMKRFPGNQTKILLEVQNKFLIMGLCSYNEQSLVHITLCSTKTSLRKAINDKIK